MNYRTMVKGALALSLSLTVASAMAATTKSSDVQAYGATFEDAKVTTVGQKNDYAYTEGDGITNTKYRVTNVVEPYGWLAAAEDESKIIAGGPAGSSQTLQLNTDANTLTNKFADEVAGAVNTALANEGTAFFETDVKFVASDTLDAGIQGGQDATKFAIYAYCDDSAGTGTTNLVVFHAYYDGATLKYTNEVFNTTLIDCDVYTKLRVEMKQSETLGGDTVNVFSVKVGNNNPLTSDTAFEDDIWFLTAEHLSNEDQLISSLNFKGTGEIDNLSVGTITETTEYAIDWTGSVGVTVTNAAGTTLAAADTNFVAGTSIYFTADATPEGNVITNVLVNGTADSNFSGPAATYTYTVGEADAIVTVLAGVPQSQPAQEKPAWAADSGDGSASDPYWAWAADHAAGQNLNAQGANYSAQYLMDINADKTPVLKIDSIEVTAEGSKIVVSATDGTTAIDLEDINGVLNVSVGSSVTTLTSKAIPENNVSFDAGKATVIIPVADGAFVKATVDFKAPENSSLTAVAAQSGSGND